MSLCAMARQLRRVLLLGVPALALVGLLGLAAWLWGRSRRRTGRARALSHNDAATSEEERSPARKLRASAEAFYPSAAPSNHRTPAESPEKKRSHATIAETEAAAMPPHVQLLPPRVLAHPLKATWMQTEQSKVSVGKGKGVHLSPRAAAENPSQLRQTTGGGGSAMAERMDALLTQQRSAESLSVGISMSTSQTTSSSGFSEALLKSDDSGILAQGRKYPLASSDVHSETFSEAESFGSAEDISTRQLPIHEESNMAHSLLLANTDKTATSAGLIGKPLISNGKSNSGGISASVSAPDLPVSRLQSTSPPQASLSMVSRDVDSPLLRLDSFKNRVKVTVQLPRDSVGRFIGKQGRNIKTLMSESNTHVYVNQKNLPKEAVSVPCHIQGSPTEVEIALKQISIKFPEIDIPSSIDDVSSVSATPLGSLSPLFANIEEGVSWDVPLKQMSVPESSPFYAMVSYIESLTRLWLFPYESSPKLDELHQNMSFFYSYASSMGLPRVKEGDGGMVGRFCAAKVSNIHWLRGHVTKIGDDAHSYELQLVDYGSAVVLPPTAMRPLK